MPNVGNGSSATTPEEEVGRDVLTYEWIRDRIIDGTILHGSRIREREIAAELDVSRIPVREALPRLEAEGYIRTVHRRGAVVTPMRMQEVFELFTVRSALEPLSAREAALRCAEGASPERLKQSLDAAEEALHSGDARRIANATAEFHDEIVELSGNELLKQITMPIRGRVKRFFNIVTQEGSASTHQEHVTLYQAISLGQAERAAALALAHLEHGRYAAIPLAEKLFSE